MAEKINPIKKRIQDIFKEKPHYRKPAIDYLRYEMKMMDQHELIRCLQELNIRELRMAIGAGVPGSALLVAHGLLKQRTEELEAFLEQSGAQAVAHYIIPTRVGGRQKKEEDEEQYTETVETDQNGGNQHGKSRVQTFEEG